MQNLLCRQGWTWQRVGPYSYCSSVIFYFLVVNWWTHDKETHGFLGGHGFQCGWFLLWWCGENFPCEVWCLMMTRMKFLSSCGQGWAHVFQWEFFVTISTRRITQLVVDPMFDPLRRPLIPSILDLENDTDLVAKILACILAHCYHTVNGHLPRLIMDLCNCKKTLRSHFEHLRLICSYKGCVWFNFFEPASASEDERRDSTFLLLLWKTCFFVV